MSVKTLLTATEFASFEFPSNERYELLEGELLKVSSPTASHNLLLAHLFALLTAYLKSVRGGIAIPDVDCQLNLDTVLRPDISVFLGDQSHDIDLERVPIQMVPSVAIEVLSPNDRSIEINRKVEAYLVAGVLEVWLVDPKTHQVQVIGSDGGRTIRLTTRSNDILESQLLPGFSLPLNQLFA
jgi:Uma2 family endonuclease